jgi:hypothetical protein
MFHPTLETHAVGRNGVSRQIGIDLCSPKETLKLQLSPINSKGMITNCVIQIPLEYIPEFIEQLKKHVK